MATESLFQMQEFFFVPAQSNDSSSPRLVWRKLSQIQFCILYFFIGTTIFLITVIGILTNLVNIYVFVKTNSNDFTDISFLALSISDFIASCGNCVWAIGTNLRAFEVYRGPFLPLDPEMILFFSGGVGVLFNAQAALITIFIALARCACVAMPMTFKTVFTGKRCIALLVFFTVVATVGKLPSMSTHRSVPRFTGSMNTSRLVRSGRRDLSFYLPFRHLGTMTTHIVIPFLTQFVLLICVGFMAWAMKRAARFREKSTAAKDTENEKTGSSKLSQKELQVVQQVVVLCVVHLMCNVPKLIVGVYTTFFDDVKKLTETMGYARLNKLLHPLRRIFECVNSAINLAIYLKYNRKFRDYCVAHGLWFKIITNEK